MEHALTHRWRPAILVAAALAVAMIAGCREEEQDRVLRYQKGLYLGAQDTPLTEQQVEALRHRSSAGSRI